MGFYAERIFPRILNVAMNTRSMREIRARVCEGLEGDVLEVGFGTGHNLPFIPSTVSRLHAVDPLMRGRELAADRLAAAPFPVEFVGVDGQRIPLADDSVDAALVTWTLCSIDDAVAAVVEIARVVRRSGTVHFVEHGRSPDERVRRWQERLDPMQQKLACGCHLDRDIPRLLEAGGLSIERLDTFYNKGEPKPWGWTFEGRARVT